MKTEQQYKSLTIKEFTKAAEIYESENAGISSVTATLPRIRSIR